MIEQSLSIHDAHGNTIGVVLKRDRRLKRSSHWERLPDGTLLLRVPYRFPKHSLGTLLQQITFQLDQADARRASRTDAALQARAELINRKHFNGVLRWNSIRWVNNMQCRLASCTRGGNTDGEIRISARIKDWPGWVVDYVIAHELMHRRHPNHSQSFWDELSSAYPLTERARGFIHGMGFAAGQPLEDD